MKRLIYKLFALLSVIVISNQAFTISAQTFTYEGINYKIISTYAKTAQVLNNQNVSGDIVIPEEVEYSGVKYTVTGLSIQAFSRCSSLASIKIPESVTFIGNYCFSGCTSLTSINIPSNITSLGAGCFEACTSLTSIKIPENVTSLGIFCFSCCYSLTSINIPSSVKHIGSNCFTECSSLSSINIPPDISSLEDACFSSCTALTSINIPDGITSIGDGCFSSCTALTSINIPDGVTSIGAACFSSCTALTSINLPSSITRLEEMCFIDCSSLSSINIPNEVTSFGDNCFNRCSSLTSINIPDKVTSFGDQCFDGCSSLTSINIPVGITSIPNYCFYGCSSVSSFDIPEGVTSLGERCFGKCAMPTITIPSTVTTMAVNCFGSCTGLMTITSLNPTPPFVDWEGSFAGMSNKTLYVPAGSIDAYKTANFWKEFGQIKSLNSIGSSIQGSGTEADPYLIATAEDLCFAHNLMVPNETIYLKQTADIDMNGVTDFEEIIDSEDKTIHYDGDYHVIKNYASLDRENPKSIFGIFSGTLKNLGIEDALIETEIHQKKYDDSSRILVGIIGKRIYSESFLINIFVSGKIQLLCSKEGPNNYSCLAGGALGSVGIQAASNATLTISDSFVQIEFDWSKVTTKDHVQVGGFIASGANQVFYDNSYAYTTLKGPRAHVFNRDFEDDIFQVPTNGGYLLSPSGCFNNTVAFGNGPATYNQSTNLGEPSVKTFPTPNKRGVQIIQKWSAFNEGKLYNGLPALNWQQGNDVSVSFPNGDGSPENPYLISSAEDLCNAHNLISEEETAYFKQTADIDMSNITNYIPIAKYKYYWGGGYAEKRFYPINYDGNYHVIKNFKSTDPNNPNSIFGIFAGKISNLGVIDAYIESKLDYYYGHNSRDIGILANQVGVRDTTIMNIVDNVFVTGKIKINNGQDVEDDKFIVANLGGMFGTVVGCLDINNSYSHIDVNGPEINIYNVNSGSLIGFAYGDVLIRNTYTSGFSNNTGYFYNIIGTRSQDTSLSFDNLVGFNDVNGVSNEVHSNVVFCGSDYARGISIVQSWDAFNQKKLFNKLPALNWQDGDYIDNFIQIPTINYDGRYAKIVGENEAELLYAINGGSYVKYTDIFDVKGLHTITAYARKDGYSDSELAEYQVTSYGSDYYVEIGNGGSLDDAYKWSDAAVRNSILANPNFLAYADDNNVASVLNGKVSNIVVDGKADLITLSDAGSWHCPREFEAASVSFTRDFSKVTAIDGGCAGWETIALPFDVQTVAHEKGELYPFAANSDPDAHRFWLYAPSSYEWQAASEIEANVPYLIAMPNNPLYYEPFNITGPVTFSANNVTIPATPTNLSYNFRDGYSLNANYISLSADSQRLVVNDQAVDGNEPGSCFVAEDRPLRPFEAYLTAPGQNRVPIFNTTSLADGLMSEMALRVWCDTPQSVAIFAPYDATIPIYDISGRAVRTVKITAGETVRINDLTSGLYIIAKTKIAIH